MKLPPSPATPSWKKRLEWHAVTQEQVDSIESQSFIWHGLLLSGAYHVWCSPPGGGKTTIALQAASDLSADGYDVFFFQLDAPASQLKEQYSIAKQAGFKLITTLREGSSEHGLVDLLRQTSESESLADYVFILDTVKKFTDINFKPAAKAFYEICRAITRRGGTVLSLAHTNKYSDDDLLIPEGVGDLRNDCDNLAMMYSKKDKNTGTITVNFEHDAERHGKSRGAKDMTLEISAERKVSKADFKDLREEERQEQEEATDQPVIAILMECLRDSRKNQQQLTDMAKERAVSVRQSRKILQRYEGKYWSVTTGENNASFYERL